MAYPPFLSALPIESVCCLLLVKSSLLQVTSCKLLVACWPPEGWATCVCLDCASNLHAANAACCRLIAAWLNYILHSSNIGGAQQQHAATATVCLPNGSSTPAPCTCCMLLVGWLLLVADCWLLSLVQLIRRHCLASGSSSFAIFRAVQQSRLHCYRGQR